MSSDPRQFRGAMARLDRCNAIASAAAATRAAAAVAADAEAHAPSRTGDLKSKIGSTRADPSAPVVVATAECDSPHAAAQEFGTATVHAHPFWRPAVNHAIGPARADAARLLRQALQ